MFLARYDISHGVLHENGSQVLFLTSFLVLIFLRLPFSGLQTVFGTLIGVVVVVAIARMGVIGTGDLLYYVSVLMVYPYNPLFAEPNHLFAFSPFQLSVISNSFFLVLIYQVVNLFRFSKVCRMSLFLLIACIAVASPLAGLIATVVGAISARSARLPFIPFIMLGTLLSIAVNGTLVGQEWHR